MKESIDSLLIRWWPVHVTRNACSSFVIILILLMLPPMQSLLGSIASFGAERESHFSQKDAVSQPSHAVLALLKQLKFGNESQQSEAKEKLLALGNSSAERRGEIVVELVKLVSNPDRVRRRLLVDDQGYRTFKIVIDLLGRLRAIEALESLIACLDCNDGRYGESASTFPVQGAIAAMGDAAIPFLEKALSSAPPQIRVRTATTLAMIGTDRARAILENASRNEKDEDVKWAIRIALRGLDSRQGK